MGSGAIDWAEVRARVDRVGRRLLEQGAPDPAQARAILESRARALSRPASPSSGERFDVVTFVVSGETYALEPRHITGVFRPERVTPLPGAQAPVFGIVSWRGELLTVLDLRALLELPGGPPEEPGHVLVLGAARPAFGILAGEIGRLVRLDSRAVTAPMDGGGAGRKFVRGVTEEAVVVLEGEALLRSWS